MMTIVVCMFVFVCMFVSLIKRIDFKLDTLLVLPRPSVPIGFCDIQVKGHGQGHEINKYKICNHEPLN